MPPQRSQSRDYAERSQGKSVQRKQPTLTEVIEKARMYDPKFQQVQKLNDAVARFLAQECNLFTQWKSQALNKW